VARGHRPTVPEGPGLSPGGGDGDTGVMGFNPMRPRRKSPADYAMVIGALVVLAVLVAWAFFG
jgi:hypothetical protein